MIAGGRNYGSDLRMLWAINGRGLTNDRESWRDVTVEKLEWSVLSRKRKDTIGYRRTTIEKTVFNVLKKKKKH